MTHLFRKGPANPSLPRRAEIAAQALRKGDAGLPLGWNLGKHNDGPSRDLRVLADLNALHACIGAAVYMETRLEKR